MSRFEKNKYVLYSDDEDEAEDQADSLETVEVAQNRVYDTSIGSKRDSRLSMTSDADETAQASLSHPRVIDETADSSVESASASILDSDDSETSIQSRMLASPPEALEPPLARSSILPVPRDFGISSVREAFTTRFLPIPQDLINPKEKVEVVDISDSSLEDYSSTEQQGLVRNAEEVFVIEESDASSSTSASHPGSFKNVETSSTNTSSQLMGRTSVESTNSSTDSQSELRSLRQQIDEKSLALRNLEYAVKNCNPKKLNDGGLLLRQKRERCSLELGALRERFKCAAADNNDDIKVLKTFKQDKIFLTADQKTSHLGQKGLQTHRVETALTMDALVSLHSSLAAAPSANTMEADPIGLKVELMSHQRRALAWLLHREQQSPPGGILADDMGLGKTLTMIALVIKSKELGQNNETSKQMATKKHPGKTLVVCPASLIGQWESQVKQHVKRDRLTTLSHHGPNREGRGSYLTGADIVITTYGVLAQENKEKVAIFRVCWDRIILDEAHLIRNHKTQSAVAACELEAKYRWCLTGTPVHNKQLDIYSLLKFLRCSPFDDLLVWKRWVDNKTAAGTERLNTVIKSILLRRTKVELQAIGELGDLLVKERHEVQVELDEGEHSVYESVLQFSQTLVARYLQEQAEKADGGLMAPRIQQLKKLVHAVPDIKTHDIFVLLLRLRQICCLPGLISAMLEEGDANVEDGFEKPDALVEDLFKQVRRLTISAPIPTEKTPEISLDKVLLTSNPVFNIRRPSSKMRTVLNILKEVLNSGDKVIVVSQWSSYLRHFGEHVKSLGVKFGILDGSLAVKARGPLVDEFNNMESQLRLLLLSLTAGGVGLNLIGANHLFLLEPHWNPQLEAQACDRVYRVGQKKPVHIYKVICKDTIEEQIVALQVKKLAMAENAVSGQLRKELTKLSLQDLKSLFGLDPIPSVTSR